MPRAKNHSQAVGKNVVSFVEQDITRSQKPNNLARAALALFFRLAEEWDINQTQQLKLLGLTSRTTLKNYRERVDAGENFKLPADTLERLSLIAGIRKAVEIMYPEHRWNDFMSAPNRAFGGATLLQWMLKGKVGSLYDVRRYLDASRGAHFA